MFEKTEMHSQYSDGFQSWGCFKSSYFQDKRKKNVYKLISKDVERGKEYY